MVTETKPKLVAILDDDELMRGALQGLLKAVGLPAQAFASAEEFLKSDERHQIAGLIADIRMPGMSGLELQAKLNHERCRIPIIFITAHGDEKMRMQALRAGAVEFLAKPFDDEVLLESVRAALAVRLNRMRDGWVCNACNFFHAPQHGGEVFLVPMRFFGIYVKGSFRSRHANLGFCRGVENQLKVFVHQAQWKLGTVIVHYDPGQLSHMGRSDDSRLR